MKAVVLSVVPRERPLLRAASCLVDWELQRAGYDAVERFDVGMLKLGFCQGEFDCWLRTPGRCKIHDSEQAIIEAIPGSDALVLLGPIAFGGHCSVLKRAIDRLIGLVSPFFEQRAGLTHHQARYAHYPRLYSVGVIPARDDAQTATFHALNDANAINLFAPERGALVLDEAHSESWQDALRGMLERPRDPGASIESRKALTSELLEAARPESLLDRPLKSAAILIGSAKKKGTSASEHMARAFVTALSRLGVECQLHYATEFVHDSDQAFAAARSIAKADLFLLATPLYVDSLPSLATRALELVEAARQTERCDAVFVPLINCGFPEPEHTRTALHIARNFARAAGYAFAGALPLGAGGVVTPERSLEEPRPPVSHVVRAIALTAPALAAGGPVPEAALRAILEPPLPEFLYRVAGELGFRHEAHQLGTHQRELRAAPFGSAR